MRHRERGRKLREVVSVDSAVRIEIDSDVGRQLDLDTMRKDGTG